MSRSQLFVGRLPVDIRERDIEQVFEKYGRLLRCDVKFGMFGAAGRRGLGRTGMAYAFVDYEDRRDAEDAIKYENGREIKGQSIVVEWARGPSNRYRDNSNYGRNSYSNYGRRDNYGGGGGRSSRGFQMQRGEECYRCRRTGHWARDCPEQDRDRYDRGYARSSRNRSRSRSRSNRRRSPSFDRSRSRSLERSRRSDSREDRTKRRSQSASVSPAKSMSRSRSRSVEKTHKKKDKSKKARASTKSRSRSRSRSKSVSRSPSPARKASLSPRKSPDNDEDKHQSEDDFEKDRSQSVSPPHKSAANHSPENNVSDAESDRSHSR